MEVERRIGTLGVVNVARTISGFENLARLSQVSEQRVVTFILLAWEELFVARLCVCGGPKYDD